jgi:hypothetical protein
MEGLAAVSLAGNILQLIHTTRQLVSTSREIFDTGTKNKYLELEVIAKELRNRADRINIPKNANAVSTGGRDYSMESLAIQCKDIADTLLHVLEKLKLKDDSSKWRSFLQSLRTQWHDPEIEALQERLNSIGQAVNARLADNSTTGIYSRLEKLLDNNRRLEISRTQDIMKLRKHFDEALKDNRNQVEEALKDDQKQVDEGQLAEKISKVASDSLHYSAEQIILSKLRFIRLEDRYSSISSAHRNTLAWLFGTPSTQERQVNSTTFVQWLQSDDDLYWVSGRPGSGKSTLMKYLCTHPKTKEHLEAWAKSDDVIVAEYFFWNAGKNDLQKSQEGLLRSLLYQVLRKCPDYIHLVFPGAWRLHNPTDIEVSGDANTEIPDDIEGLMDALKRTCILLTRSEKRLCFFIDGLDEYGGDTFDVIQLVGVLRTLNHVKLCVSSRQWNEFEDAYGKSRTAKLYMQHFNKEDINAYIDDVFSNDDNYQELEDKETRGKALVEEIVTAANGVFFWVVLVVRSFQEGLREGDSISRLQSRLRELPTNLEEYFHRILFQDVKETYRDQAAQMFLVALVAKENLPLMAYWFLDEKDVPTERQPLKMQQTTKRHRVAKKRLNASCKGLLEPHFQSSAYEQDSLPSAVLFEYRVDFLHRTVRDYLELPTSDIQHWAPAGFDPHEAICKALYSQIKTAPHGQEYGPHISTLYQIFYYHANIIWQSQKDNPIIRELHKELQTIMSWYGVTTVGDPPIRVADTHNSSGGTNVSDADYLISIIVEHTTVESRSKTKSHNLSSSAVKRWVSKFSRKKSKSAGDAKTD